MSDEIDLNLIQRRANEGWYDDNPYAPQDIRALLAHVAAMQAELDGARTEIDKAWFAIENGWDIEPRSYFEREAPKNGFGSALAQAVHHMWKRKTKDATTTEGGE